MAIAQLKGDTAVLGSGDYLGKTPTICRVKWQWSDDWETVPYLWAVNATQLVSPGVSHATLRYDYGTIKREDTSSFAHCWPPDLTDAYVQIAVIYNAGGFGENEAVLWTGIIAAPAYGVEGARNNQPSGVVDYTAYGLEYLLDRATPRSVYVEQYIAGDTAVEIDWMPPFNMRHRFNRTVQGNRSSSRHSLDNGDAYLWSIDGELWSVYDIIEYLANVQIPAEIAGVTFAFDIPPDVRTLLDATYEEWNFEGMTLRHMLNMLISRKRGLGWYAQEDGGVVYIRIFSVAVEDMAMGDNILPANDYQVALNLEESIDWARPRINIHSETQYQRIIVQGARVMSCFTVSFEDGTLEKGWTAAEETAYGSAGDDERATERYQRVYQHFRIPYQGFDWQAGDGVGGGNSGVVPDIDDEGNWTDPSGAPEGYLNAFKGLLPVTPFLIGYDYESDIESPTDRNPSYSDPTYVRPMVFIKNTVDNTYYYVDRPGPGMPMVSYGSVTMLDREMAFTVNVNPNHQLGLNHFSGDSVLTPSAGAQVDYEDIIATVFAETDKRLRVTVYQDFAGNDQDKTLIINVPDAELWYVAADTVFDIASDGSLKYVSGSGAIRDDSERLRVIAAMAQAWYRNRRATLTAGLAGIQDILPLGAMITTAGLTFREEIGTVITQKTWDFTGGMSNIQTGYVELDFAGLV